MAKQLHLIHIKIVEKSRDSIGYHAALDHYGIDLENGNMFEWAKDISTNDKDIVFVLNLRCLLMLELILRK